MPPRIVYETKLNFCARKRCDIIKIGLSCKRLFTQAIKKIIKKWKLHFFFFFETMMTIGIRQSCLAAAPLENISAVLSISDIDSSNENKTLFFKPASVIYEGVWHQLKSDENNLRKSTFKCSNHKVSLCFKQNSSS